MFKHILLVLLLIGAFLLWEQRPISHGVGVVAANQPALEKVGLRNEIQLQHYILKPKWKVEGTSRVLSKKGYWFDDKKHLAPYDFVLGWNAMSDERILNQVKLPISNRQYKIDVIKPPLTFNEMKSQVMFMHAIPSTEEIREAMQKAREGSVISYKGYIVDIKDQSDWIWTSSIQDKSDRLDASQIVWIQEFSTL